ncbi:hypothetical protein CJ030_MR4G025311 [Morella rubra]|uniref:Late embryogenesis abundant protein LEA-2 subgroup domain-containing protein n=1 Tax=Morella rubra TaxID=262757 RepID=A0A6A1VR34_9ROSI|nr:hypothetical protein CJ030_MR4G025311 [Morella rubra]
MEDELPFAHSKIYPKSDEEVATFRELKRERSGKCFVYVFAALVLLSICFMIFALIVLRVNIPDVNLSSLRVKNLRYKQATSSSAASFNATFVAEMTIKNTNLRFECIKASMKANTGMEKRHGTQKTVAVK